jgi:hypothetical protein
VTGRDHRQLRGKWDCKTCQVGGEVYDERDIIAWLEHSEAGHHVWASARLVEFHEQTPTLF